MLAPDREVCFGWGLLAVFDLADLGGLPAATPRQLGAGHARVPAEVTQPYPQGCTGLIGGGGQGAWRLEAMYLRLFPGARTRDQIQE